MSDDHNGPLLGGCLCGAVRYEIGVEPKTTAHCYCKDCRKASGTGHCTHVVVQEEGFSISGEVAAYDRPADSGNVVRRHFCPKCGSAIYSMNSGMTGPVFVRASSLDDPNAVTPRASVYASRAPKWDPIDPSLPAFAEMPTQAEREAMTAKG